MVVEVMNVYVALDLLAKAVREAREERGLSQRELARRLGAFLGSALMRASQQGHVAEGMLMLLAYSLGLGIPFLLSAVLIDYLKSAFNWIKGHYRAINLVCGVFLVLVGILMATGTLGRLLSLLS